MATPVEETVPRNPPTPALTRSILSLAFCVLAIPRASAEACPSGELLHGAPVRAVGAQGDPRLIVDGRLVVEGTPPLAGAAVTSTDPSAFVIADLGAPRTINAFVLQADQNDFYSVEGSLDGVEWFGFWRASPVGGGAGLRSRSARLPRPGQARYLRVRGQGGDRRYAVSELRAYCRPPAPWPPAFLVSESAEPWIGATTVLAVKGLVAVGGMAFFLVSAVRRRRRPAAGETAGTRRLLLGLALAGGLCWWNLGAFNAGHYVHDWEHYHYYLGSKYFSELGYARLYACSAVADAEDGLGAAVAERKIRNLESNRIESTAGILGDPDGCKQHFSPERWEAFRGDVAWFRGQVSPAYWERAQLDHGYNAPPLWTLVGGGLARLASPASKPASLALALIDPLLLVVMWTAVFRTFELRAVAAALIWWGTNQAADFSWTGGAFLRQDWLVLTVLGLCAMVTGRPGWGGFALAWATLLRVFPGFLVAALVLQTLPRMVRDRSLKLSEVERRFALGSVAALAILGGLSLGAGGLSAWTEFVSNARVHLGSHGSNTLGLEPVLAYEHASRLEATGDQALDDPFRDWEAARNRVLERRWPFGVAALAAFVVLLVWAVRRPPPWVVLVLGIGLIPFTTAQSCYYYSILLGYGLLVDSRRDVIGALLCALAAISLLCAVIFPDPAVMDQRFVALSVALLVFVPCATWFVARDRDP